MITDRMHMIKTVRPLSISDAELRHVVSRAQAGDDDAMGMAVAAVIKRVCWLALRYKQPNITDDLIQEGVIGVMRAVRSFDSARGSNTTFVAFAGYYAKARMWQYAKRLTSANDMIVASIDDVAVEDGGKLLHEMIPANTPGPYQECRNEDDKKNVTAMMSKLDEKEREVVANALGMNWKRVKHIDLARRDGVSHTVISNRLRKGLEKMRMMAKEEQK